MKKLVGKILAAFVLLICLPAGLFVNAEEERTSMSAMHSMQAENVDIKEEEIVDSYGNTYSGDIVEFNVYREADVTYDLKGAYKEFSGTIICESGATTGMKIYLAFFADGELLYDLKDYDKQQPAKEFSVDVTGVGELTIKVMSIGADYGDSLYFVNSSFFAVSSPQIYPDRGQLQDLVVIDESECSQSTSLIADSFGELHNGSWSIYADGFVLYNLKKEYKSLSGKIIAKESSFSHSCDLTIEFLLDNKVICTKKINNDSSKPVGFNINISNGEVLKIVVSGEGKALITDDILKKHEHTLQDWEITVEAKCTTEGKKVRVCKTCGKEVLSEVIPALGHTPNGKWEIKEATSCEKPGKEVQHCISCKEECETREIKQLPHKPDGKWTIEKEATCKEKGLRYQKCTVCGNSCEEEAIPLVEHTFGKWENISGSAWNPPVIKVRTCSVCGYEDRSESNVTSWLKPLVIVFVMVLLGLLLVLAFTLKMNGLGFSISNVKKLFSKDALDDDDIDEILNKPEK